MINKKLIRVITLFSLLLILGGVLLVLQGWRLLGQEETSTAVNNTRKQIEEPLSASQLVQGVQGESARAIKVVDGDTIEVQLGEGVSKLRYIGIDTPETIDPRRPVGCFGKEASNENKRLVEGKEVVLQKDISETDKFGRLLRYVYLKAENGQLIFVNDYLLRSGFARSATYPPDVKYSEQFRQAEKEAKDEGRGLWGKCVT